MIQYHKALNSFIRWEFFIIVIYYLLNFLLNLRVLTDSIAINLDATLLYKLLDLFRTQSNQGRQIFTLIPVNNDLADIFI